MDFIVIRDWVGVLPGPATSDIPKAVITLSEGKFLDGDQYDIPALQASGVRAVPFTTELRDLIASGDGQTGDALAAEVQILNAGGGGGGGPGSDTTAIHVDTAGEIVGIDQKVTPVGGDWLVIEDSENSDEKARIRLQDIPSASGGEINTSSSAGGESLVLAKVTFNLPFKGLAAGAGIQVTSQATTLTIVNTAPGEFNSASNLGAGSPMVASGGPGTLTFRSIVGADGIGVANDGTEVTISGSGLVPISRQVIAGTGLTGGGALTGNVTLNLANAGPFLELGGGTMTGAIAMGGQAITNAGAVTSTGFSGPLSGNVTGDVTGDVNSVTLSAAAGAGNFLNGAGNYVDPAFLPLAGGTMTGTLAMGANDITGTGAISAATFTGDLTGDVNGVTLDGAQAGGLLYLDDSGAYSAPPGGGGGEVNTASSAGGVSLVLTKSGVNLPFRGLAAGTGIGLATDATTLTITNTSPGEVNAGNNLGAGAGVFFGIDTAVMQFRGLVGADGITTATTATDVTISGSGLVPVARQVIAGTGLTGGGALSGDVTLNLANAGPFLELGGGTMTGAIAMGGQAISGGGAITSSAFSGPLTGNVTGDLTGDVNSVTLTAGGAATSYLGADGNYSVPAGAAQGLQANFDVDPSITVGGAAMQVTTAGNSDGTIYTATASSNGRPLYVTAASGSGGTALHVRQRGGGAAFFLTHDNGSGDEIRFWATDDGIIFMESGLTERIDVNGWRFPYDVDGSFILPVVDGADGDVMATDGAGNIEFVEAAVVLLDYVYVEAKSDLPTPAAGVITLADDTVYRINGTIVLGTDRLVGGTGTIVAGMHNSRDILFYTGTGAVLSASGGASLRCNNLTISATLGALFDGVDCPVVNIADVSGTALRFGRFEDTGTFFATQCAVVELESGIELVNATTGDLFAIINSRLGQAVGGTGTLLDFGTSVWDGIQVSQLELISASGGTDIDGAASSANLTTSTGRGRIANAIINGSGTPLAGITVDDELWSFSNNIGIADSVSVGSMSLSGNSTATTIGTIDVFVKIAGTTTLPTAKRFDAGDTPIDNNVRSTGLSPLTVNITVTAILTKSGGAKDYQVQVHKNGNPIGVPADVTVGTASVPVLLIPTVVDADTDDLFDLRIANTEDTDDVTGEDFTMTIIGL